MLLNPTSLCSYVSLPDYPSISEFPALVDCGSSHCFMETSVIRKQKLHTYSIPPILLHLFDGTCNATISKAIEISIHFSSGKVTSNTLLLWIHCVLLSLDIAGFPYTIH
jgi:hypothetical protein